MLSCLCAANRLNREPRAQQNSDNEADYLRFSTFAIDKIDLKIRSRIYTNSKQTIKKK